MKKLSFLPLLFICQILFAQNLEIEGTIKIAEGAQAGYILTSDADGVAAWSPAATVDRKQIFVTDFGAKGDGTTDDTNAFQAAIDSAEVQASTVNIPSGNYKITQTLNVPAGVQLKGEGQGNSIDANSNSTTGSRISFYGNNVYAMKCTGDYVACRNLTIVDKGGLAAGGIHFKIENFGSSIGVAFNDLFLLDFINGTSLKLEALTSSGMAFCSFENIHIRNAKKGIHINVDTDGSFINLVSFRSINISGTGFEHGILTEGGLTTTDWYGLSMQADCPSAGHIIINTGVVTMYGLRIESGDAVCSDETVLVQLAENTRGSYMHGSAGKGRINDKGSSFIDITGESSVGIRPSGNNLFQNAGFKGFANDELPFWEFEDCSDCTTPTAITVEAPEWQENHNVLKITIAAGQTTHLGTEALHFTKAFQNKECLFGAMIKSDANDIKVSAGYKPCNSGFTASSNYPNDGNWHFVGKPAELDMDNTCRPAPRFVFDNREGSSDAVVYITTPSFVFNRGEKPALEAGPITSAGGIITGTLTTAMLEVASPANNTLQLTADANVFQISGTNAINSINPSAHIFAQGTMITLLFEDSGLQVAHDVDKIKLLGASNYIAETYSSLKLLSLGDGTWQELDRNCVNGCITVAPKLQKETETPLQETIVLTQPEQVNSSTLVNIYPNPSKYGIHIAFSEWEYDENYQVHLLDASGRILLKKGLNNAANWLDFQELNLVTGRYQVHIFAGKKSVYSKGVIVKPN
ncbi:MAG: glycosyl hydrolase family 28-related protein [Saprospiraceae bacterium]